MGFSSFHLALLRAALLAGLITVAPAWGDVSKTATAPVNTDTRARDREKDRRETDPYPTPPREDRIPVVEPKRLKILRGESIEITLDTVADAPSRRVRFVVRDEPTAGFLSDLEEPGEDLSAAKVIYSSDPSSTASVDQFTFAAQYPAGRVSAPVAVILDIVQPAAVIRAVATIEFGRTVLGMESVRTIVLSNTGTAAYELAPELEAPWSWDAPEGSAPLVILPGASAPATFRYRPTALGGSVHRLPLPTGSPDKPGVLFSGEGVIPFTVDKESLELEFDPKGRHRFGKLTVTNPGQEGTNLLLHLPGRLQSPIGTRLWLDKGERRDLSFTLPAQDSASLQGILGLEVAGYHREVSVSAKATPGHLELPNLPPDRSINFAELHPGESTTAQLTVRNSGGQPLLVKLSPPPSPFTISGLPPAGLALAPGATTELTLGFSPTAPRSWKEPMVLSTSDQELSLTLRGQAVPVPSTVDVSTTSSGLNGGGLVASGSPLPNGQNGPNPQGTAGGGGGAADSTGDYRNMFARAAATPAGIGDLRGAASSLPKVPQKVQGRNGSIALPPMISQDGLIAYSPYKTKTDVKLPTVPLFRVHHTTTRSALLVWPRPKELQGAISYEVEARTTLFNPASRRPECVWVPAKKMKLTVEPTYVTAEVRGLDPDSHYLFRVFTLGPEETHSLPSRESSARTLPITFSLDTMLNLGIATILLGAGAGLYLHFRRDGSN
jgi:hypothetical protein